MYMTAVHATRHHYHSMRPLPLPLSTRPPIDFDARIAAWEKNEAREASIMSSATATATATATVAASAAASAGTSGRSPYRPEESQLLSHPRSLHLSTIEPSPRNPHQHHNGADHVWRPNPSPHMHRTFPPIYLVIPILNPPNRHHS
jgi:hypothetical protein